MYVCSFWPEFRLAQISPRCVGIARGTQKPITLGPQSLRPSLRRLAQQGVCSANELKIELSHTLPRQTTDSQFTTVALR